MKVFIENEAGKAIKNIFDEKKLEFKKSYPVSEAYPFPYGFVIGTTSGDGDNLDVFVLTNQPLKSKQIVEAMPIGLLEMIEDDEIDHKILATLPGHPYELTDETIERIRYFITNVFNHLPGKRIEIGKVLPAADAIRMIEESTD